MVSLMNEVNIVKTSWGVMRLVTLSANLFYSLGRNNMIKDCPLCDNRIVGEDLDFWVHIVAEHPVELYKEIRKAVEQKMRPFY